MAVQEMSVGSHRETEAAVQIRTYDEARLPIYFGDLKTLTRVYLPAMQWEAELVRWLAHAAHGNEDLKQRFLDRCIDMLEKNRDGCFAPFRQMH
jgi:hypothetical protein